MSLVVKKLLKPAMFCHLVAKSPRLTQDTRLLQISLLSLVVHQVGRFEFRIFVLIFSTESV
jgi:hypothetical protein